MYRKAGLLAGAVLTLGLIFPVGSKAEPNHAGGERLSVFVMTNSADKNEVVGFVRIADGSLQESRTFATGGRGSGGGTDPLESQGSLVLSTDHSLLLAVNAGSGDITVFAVNGSELSRTDRVASGGSFPNAIVQQGNLVYVLNSGGGSNVTGFRLEQNGKLTRIPGATSFLTTNIARGGSLAFSPNGRFLVVTEKATNLLDAFPVNEDGTLGDRVITTSAGPGLFAVVFAPNGAAIASETGAAGGFSAISSYAVSANGSLTPITASLTTAGAATCWQAVTPDGRFVYSSNSATATISGFAIGNNGTLTALAGTVVATLAPGAANLDVAISSDGQYLQTLNSKAGTVSTFHINQDGTLTFIGEINGVTANAGFNGIAAL